MKKALLSLFALAVLIGTVVPAHADDHHHRHCYYRHHHRHCR